MTQALSSSMIPIQATIGLKLRKDIAWDSHQDRQALRPVWIAEDPLTSKFFRCSQAEHDILHWLDEQATLVSIQNRFNDEFAPQTIELEQIQSLVNRCAQSGLLVPFSSKEEQSAERFAIWPRNSIGSDTYPKSRTVIVQQGQLRDANWFLASMQSVASMLGKLTQSQCSLGSPDRFIAPLVPTLGWLFSGAAVGIWLVSVTVIALLIGLRFEALQSELPDLRLLRSPAFLIGYGAIFVLTRVIHELGHAIACKRAGASCNDAGLIFSFGMVCPYVDITDSWRVGNKFTRMGIALAGIYMESMVALVAAVIWLSTHAGWIHDLALQVMLVCTVTTLLFNANPLMKYDGYFVLCDWLNTQNLRERSFASLDAMLDGRPRNESVWFSLFLIFYFLASTCNRLILMLGLMTMVYVMASQLEIAGLGLALIVLYGCCLGVTSMAAWTMSSKSKQGSRALSKRAMWLGWTSVCLLIAWAVNMPLPNRVFAIGNFQYGERHAIYSGLPGRIVEFATDGQPLQVSKDATLIRLENPNLVKRILDLETLWLRKVCQLDTIERRTAFLDEHAIAMVPKLRAEIVIAANELSEMKLEQSKLRVTAPQNGWFEPAISSQPDAPTNPADAALGLGTPYAAKSTNFWASDSSRGRLLERGTLVGWIVKDQGGTIECRLPEEQIAGISTETEVRVSLTQSPGQIFVGKVIELARVGQIDSVASKRENQTNDVRPMTYRVRIRLIGNGEWTLYANGNAEVVFVRPSQSIVNMASDHWMRHSKIR